MRLWTIQPKEVYEYLIDEGEFVCDTHKVLELYKDCHNHLNAYKWLCEEMTKKIGIAPKEFPIWAWYRYDWKNKKPDLRTLMFRGMDGPQVCIELEIPDNQVVLTDYDSWHNVLNNRFYNTSTNEIDFYRLEEYYENLSHELQEEIKLQSWENVFDITPFQNDFCRNGRYVQATFWKISLENVISVRFFNENRKSK